MNLPQTKYRNGKEFGLVNDFNSKLDAQKAIRFLRNSNACFGKKKSFIFSSANSSILFNYGVYEQVFYGQIMSSQS